MKNLLLIFTIAALILTAGCSPAKAPEPSPSPSPIASPSPTPTASPEMSPSPTTSPTPAPTTLAETEDMGQEYMDSIIFYGDSNTNGMRAYGVLTGGKETTQVWTPENGTLTLCFWKDTPIVEPITEEEVSITDMMKNHQPKHMIINLGLNGISFMGEEAFIKDYSEMVNAIREASPDTKIMLSSIYPVAHSYAHQGDINNEKITAANGWILRVAEATGVRFIDSASVLTVEEDGSLPESYQNGDGLHLTADSYNLVLNYIRTHGYA